MTHKVAPLFRPCSVSVHSPSRTALSSWNVHHPTRSASRRKIAEKDFLALNKAAVQSGLTSAHEQAQFRATHDIRRRDEPERVSTRSTPKLPPDMVFGISTRSAMYMHTSVSIHSCSGTFLFQLLQKGFLYSEKHSMLLG